MTVLVVRLPFTKLVAEGKLIIKKRRKSIRIADKNRDGWPVIQEYESDGLASDSEDEKIRKAKAAAEKSEKKRSVTAVTLRIKFKSSSDFQLFRGKTIISFLICEILGPSVGLPEHPTIKLLYLVIFFKGENNLRSAERSELERKCIFRWYEIYAVR